MFSTGFKCGAVAGVLLTFVGMFLAVKTALWIGGENIAEFGARMNAAERRYQIEATAVPVYTFDEQVPLASVPKGSKGRR